MKKHFTINPGRASNVVPNVRQRGPGQVITQSPPTVPASNVTPRSHQRRWSADLCKCQTPPVIIVRKNKTEPQPPQRGVSLLRTHTESHSLLKRYSCPPTGIFRSPSQSPSSSTTSSCSSPPPVQTSIITGDDPLGWKLRPKSSNGSARAHTNRLSLQIPLPVIYPDTTSSQTVFTCTPVQPTTTKPPLRPKPSRRHHSDSSAFLKSLANPVPPVVTLKELCAVHLRPVSCSDEPDDVFSDGSEGQVKKTTQTNKIPPPVPRKTAMARQIAQLIAYSQQRNKPATSKTKDNIYTRVIKPCKTVVHSSLHATKTAGLRLDTGCDVERPSPRFSGREI